MIKKYNQYITESSDNKYSYPYNRIMILISSYQDYLDIIDYIEKTFSVHIIFYYNMQSPNRVYSHVLLDVDVLYRIMNTYEKGDSVDEEDVIRFYTSRNIHGQDLINDIDADDDYLNKKDVLNVNELNSVMNLLLSGRKYSFDEIYQRNRLVYESLLDKISGPSEEEVATYFNNLKLQKKFIKSCIFGRLDSIIDAIESGIDINGFYKVNKNIVGKDNGIISLITNNHYDILKYIIEKYSDKIDLNKTNYLENIITHDKIDMFKLFIDNGVNISDLQMLNLFYKYKFNKVLGRNISSDSALEMFDYIFNKGFKPNKDLINEVKKLNDKDLLNLFSKYVNLNESLLDKLEGPTKEEIEKHYKNLYLSGKINIFDYYRYSIDNGFKGPGKKDVSDFLEGMYNNKKIKLEEYYELTRDYKLNGPSKSFLWKTYGFDKEYEPEEYFIHLTKGIEKVSPNGLYYNWVKDGKVVFEQYIKPEKLIFMKYDKTFKIYELLFDMNFIMFSKFMKEMFDKYFSDKINIYEYNFRIEYKY